MSLCKFTFPNTAMWEVLSLGLQNVKLGGQQRLGFSPLPLVPDTPEYLDLPFSLLLCSMGSEPLEDEAKLHSKTIFPSRRHFLFCGNTTYTTPPPPRSEHGCLKILMDRSREYGCKCILKAHGSYCLV